MNRIKKKSLLLVLLLLLLLPVCTGCAVRSGDGLLAAPMPSGLSSSLQKAISGARKKGDVFCAPKAGENRQPVQLADLDGDGQSEAVVLLQNEKELTLTVCVYSETDGVWTEAGRIDGCGFVFSRVEFAPLDEEPGAELLVTRALSERADKVLEVLSLKDGVLSRLFSEVCTDYVLADTENGQRLVTLQAGKTARLFRFSGDEPATVSKVPLASSFERPCAVQGGFLQKGVPAVFLTGTQDSGAAVTEVLSLQDDALRNLGTVNSEGDTGLLPTDIDGDGVTELPVLLPLSQEDGETFSLVKWYALDRKGTASLRCTTFHQSAEGWYLTIPEKWNDQIEIRTCSEAGGTGCEIMQRRADGEPLPIVSVLVFSGENRSAYGASEGRFILSELGGRTYSAELGTSAWANLLSQDELKELFHNTIGTYPDSEIQ